MSRFSRREVRKRREPEGEILSRRTWSHGGGWSLARTVPPIEFPASREKYREIRKFCPKRLPAALPMMLNAREFLPPNAHS